MCSIYRDIATQNIHDLKFDISRSMKVKVDGATGKPTYDFLFVNNSDYMPIISILRDIATQNMHDLEFDLLRSLKVKLMVPLESPHMTSY